MTSYTQAQFDGNYPPGIERHFWISARNAIIHNMLIGAGMGGDKLLDIGCGRGIVVAYLRARGVDCLGSELAVPMIAESLSPYIRTGADAADLPATLRNTIKGILLLDVIEHIEDAPAFLRRMAAAFPKASRFFITVPAQPELWSDWDNHYGHYRRYTPETLREAVLAAGLRPTKLRGFFHGLYIPMRLMSLMGIKRRTEETAPRRPAVHALMASMFRWEARLIPGWVPGSSLCMIANNPDLTSGDKTA
jgi:SAM-dependent methyltransferase